MKCTTFILSCLLFIYQFFWSSIFLSWIPLEFLTCKLPALSGVHEALITCFRSRDMLGFFVNILTFGVISICDYKWLLAFTIWDSLIFSSFPEYSIFLSLNFKGLDELLFFDWLSVVNYGDGGLWHKLSTILLLPCGDPIGCDSLSPCEAILRVGFGLQYLRYIALIYLLCC